MPPERLNGSLAALYACWHIYPAYPLRTAIKGLYEGYFKVMLTTIPLSRCNATIRHYRIEYR